MASIPRILELAKRAGRNDPAVMTLVRNALRDPELAEGAERILESICRRKGEHTGARDVFPLPEDLPSGGIGIGPVVEEQT